jgi:hypothetical protein
MSSAGIISTATDAGLYCQMSTHSLFIDGIPATEVVGHAAAGSSRRSRDEVAERRRPRRLRAGEHRKREFSGPDANGLSRRGRQRSDLGMDFVTNLGKSRTLTAKLL